MKNCAEIAEWLLIIVMSNNYKLKIRSAIFKCKLKNIYEVLLLESILIQKKILWRINLILIKFLINALIFDKLRTKCKKNPSFHH